MLGLPIKKTINLLLLVVLTLSAFSQSKLQTFKLSDVRLLQSPFKEAQETDRLYILSLDPNRLLAPYLREAGLSPKAVSYGNWENTGLDGHICGHYLSALSFMYASTDDIQIKQRLDYMIDELERCQNKNADGYLSGIPGGKEMWNEIKSGNIRSSSFGLNDKWVPLYNIHKIYAGLKDAYVVAGNERARQMLIKLTDWCLNLVANLSDQQIQELLKSEHGGLNEIFADVFSITGEEKYLHLAKRFSDQSILDPLLEKKDMLNGRHANTQIPKIIGFEQIALAGHDTAWAGAAKFFWNTVVQNRTVAIGGNSVREHFHPSNDFSSMVESIEGPETCNSYNMLKLTRQLFLSDPSNEYMDYYERTLYNHILSSQRKKGGFVYFTPMRPGHYRTYSAPQESFWCCVGSGLENHGKYGELIYAHDNTDVYVNLFIPSKLTWKEKGITITQETTFPEKELSVLKFELKSKKTFAVNVRYPSWVARGRMTFLVNGKKVKFRDMGNGYANIYRQWAAGDQLTVNMPMHTAAEFLPDGSDWVAFLYGPIVLAAELDTLGQPNLTADGSRMGHIASGPILPINDVPLVSGHKKDLSDKLIKSKNAINFNAENAIYQPKYKDLKLVPFYTLEEKRYVIYFPYSTTENLPERAKSIELAEKERMRLQEETLDLVNTGEQQPENDHDFKGERTGNGTFKDRHYRDGNGWFSYTLKNKDLKAGKVRLKFYGKDKSKGFTIWVNEVVIAHVEPEGVKGDVFYDQDFDIPKELLTPSLRVKLQADDGAHIPGIYEVRLVK